MMTWQKQSFILIWQTLKTRGLLVSGEAPCYPIFFIERVLQIFLASLLGISVCLGTASECPVCGLHHKE